ncbi:hypothetical protein [Aeromicrobium massiliense]|uniref:hypothetical protein n=1 Tax=Aeromicrobium massiliense TaxID=1464554 RepID=UPI0002F0A919|nr:hypothetical protein [Aeromicrobium massiliense]
MRTTVLATLTVLIATTAACGGGAEVAPTSAVPSVSPTPVARVDPDAARRALQEGVEQVLTEEFTDFDALVSVDHETLEQTRGTAGAERWRATSWLSTLGDSQSRTVLQSLSVDGQVWARPEEAPEAGGASLGCWEAVPEGQVPGGVSALRAQEPAYVSVLGQLQAHDFTTAERIAVRGELSSAHAVALMPAGMIAALGADAGRSSAPVDVEIDVMDGRANRLTLHGEDVLTALRKDGVEVDEDLGHALTAVDLTVDYTPGADLSTLRPPGEACGRT